MSLLLFKLLQKADDYRYFCEGAQKPGAPLEWLESTFCNTVGNMPECSQKVTLPLPQTKTEYFPLNMVFP